LSEFGAGLAVVRPNRYVEQWRRNVTTATGRCPDRGETRRAVALYLRAVLEAFVLPSWSTAEIVGSVTSDAAGEARLRAAMAGPGAVLALPHIGSWDHAGAWACATGMPVSTVAEQLGDPEFAAFKGFRERLGMRIYSHRDHGALRGLCDDVAAGRLVCLVADRTFDGRGVVASWRGVPVKSAVGPAYVARRTGAVLMGCAAHFTRTGIHLSFSEPVLHRDGQAGLTAMTQELVDFYAAQVDRDPADWHVFQPFFPDGA
jgi:KDO2-lipid IV(A) lauroyltransferase